MDLTLTQQKILKILIADTTAKKPISNLNLSKRIGLKDRRNSMEGRDMRSIIHALRVKGFPICANGLGYFYARTDGELSKFIVAIQDRIIEQEKALKGLKASFHNVGKIGGMFDGDVPTKTQVYLYTPKGTVIKAMVEVDEQGVPKCPVGYSIV